VDLSGSGGQLFVEWFDPSDGTVSDGGTVQGGGVQNFSAPFPGDAVLYLHEGSQ
jgi:hypothetical protein